MVHIVVNNIVNNYSDVIEYIVRGSKNGLLYDLT